MRPFFLCSAQNVPPDPGACPHCDLTLNIKRHGYLRGKSVDALGVIRGMRFYCSKRDSNRGCGATFSILYAQHLPGYSVGAAELVRLIREVIGGASVHLTWRNATSFFSLTSAYRWVRSFTANLARIRPMLHQADDPAANSPHSLVLLTLRTLEKLPFAAGEGGFVAAFQHHFQRAFLRPPASSCYS